MAPPAHGRGQRTLLLLLLLTLLALASLPFSLLAVLIQLARRYKHRHKHGRVGGRGVDGKQLSHHPYARPGAARRGTGTGTGTGTALVNGGRMQKAYVVCRALHAAGWRVVLVEEEGWGEWCAARFSRSVSRFHVVPSPQDSDDGAAYIDALLEIASEEGVDLFVPCSGAGTTLLDARAAALMRAGRSGSTRRIRTLIQDADLAETLHSKDRFIDLVHELGPGLDAPRSRIVRSPDEALAFLRQEEEEKGACPQGMLCKAATVLDDVGRADMTTYPLRHPHPASHLPDWTRTEARLRTGLGIPISPDTPYAVQEFIGGEGASEWCTHATVWEGELVAFVCCPSNDMLMTYHDATTTSHVGALAQAFTRTFLQRLAQHPRWKDARLTGHFSMDFIYQPHYRRGGQGGGGDDDRDKDAGHGRERLVVIECNPRIHTAVCLLHGVRADFGRALAGEARFPHSDAGASSMPTTTEKMDEKGNAAPITADGRATTTTSSSTIVVPPRDAPSISWRAHDLVARLAPRYLPLPTALRRRLYGDDLPSGDAVVAVSVERAGQRVEERYDLDACGSADGAFLWAFPSSDAPRRSSASSRDDADLKSAATTTGEEGEEVIEADDPLAYLAFYHLQWPALLLRQALLRRRAFSRINVSTARIFEC